MPTDDNNALKCQPIAAMDDGDDAVFDRLLAADFVHQNPADPAGRRQLTERWRRAFPDAHDQVEAQIAEGDTVVTRWSSRGTHRGELFGISPTGKAVTVRGIFVDRIAAGQVVEHRDEADLLGCMAQLGVA